MMQHFLSIMKDSYKEAVNGWILQAMMILVVLMMMFIVGLSFEPISPEQPLSAHFKTLSFLVRNNEKIGQPQYSIEKFLQTNAPKPYWEGDYQFDLVIHCETPDDLNKLKQTPLPHEKSQIEREVRNVFKDFENVYAEKLESNKPNELRYRVTTAGTKAKDSRAWIAEPRIFFAIETGPIFWMSLRQGVYRIEKTLVNDFGAWAAMLIAIVVTAGFIPNMLRKGALDLYIAKPISRVPLLILKYLGGTIFVFLLACFTVGGTWLVVGVRTGIWAPEFLGVIPILTFYFAILYAVSTLFAVLTRSMLVSILATVLAWGVIFGIGLAHETVEAVNEDARKRFVEAKELQGEKGVNPDEAKAVQLVPGWLEDGLLAARKVLPRTYDLDKLSGRLIARGVLTEAELKEKNYDKPPPAGWFEVIVVSLLYIAGLLALASWRMVTRDG